MVQTASYQRRYLDLLGAPDKRTFEDTVVEQLEAALRDSSAYRFPIRLSAIAPRFNIRPLPDVVEGSHDGELQFKSPPGQFVIKICSEKGAASPERAVGKPRSRFTYAHEFAHRFFYVQAGSGWERALNLVTADLDIAERLRHRIRLRKIEEGLCNNIARRVLIPDTYLAAHCDLPTWFEKGRFFTETFAMSRHLGVSLDCLLVRLQGVTQGSNKSQFCALILSESSGTILHRGFRRLRIVSGIFPAAGEDTKQPAFYPGMEVESLGSDAYVTVSGRLAARALSSRIEIPIRLRRDPKQRILTGWSRFIGRETLLVWGRLTESPASFPNHT